MTPADFAHTYRPEAIEVETATGIEADVLLAQWGVETGWGSAINNRNNLGNIRCFGGWPCAGGFAQFASLNDFVSAAVQTWHNGYYAAVLAAVGPAAQLRAIGASAWDAGHYNNGGGPGSSLLAACQEIVDVTPEQDTILRQTFNGMFASCTPAEIAAGITAQSKRDKNILDAIAALKPAAGSVGGSFTLTGTLSGSGKVS